MPAAVGAGIPSLSQILSWDTQHLYQAAADWVSTAEHWDETFTRVHRGILSPGGTVWEGIAANAAQDRTFTDLVKVRGLADALSDAAAAARRGADQLDYLKRHAIEAINEAREAGFAVGEDLSVTDTSKYSGLRVAAVRQFATTVAARAAALSAADSEIATKISTATAELAHHGFTEQQDDTVRAVDHHTITEAPPPPDPGADQPWKNQPSPRTYDEVKDALRQLRPGKNRPIRELDTPEEIHDFYDWLTGNSTGHAPSSASFPRERLDDGTIISLRPGSESGGETIGVTLPNGKEGPKVHLPLTPPIISSPPHLPPLADHPPLPPGPTPVLPPWLPNSALHGTPIPSQGATIMPGVPLPTTSAPGTSMPAPGPALLPRIGHDLADAGDKIAVGGLIGVAIVGGLLGIGPGASEATP